MNLEQAQAIIENSASHTEVGRAARYLSAEVNRFRASSERWLAEATKLGGFVTALEKEFQELLGMLLDVQEELKKIRSGHLENNARVRDQKSEPDSLEPVGPENLQETMRAAARGDWKAMRALGPGWRRPSKDAK
jgi:hypothetical protein